MADDVRAAQTEVSAARTDAQQEGQRIGAVLFGGTRASRAADDRVKRAERAVRRAT